MDTRFQRTRLPEFGTHRVSESAVHQGARSIRRARGCPGRAGIVLVVMIIAGCQTLRLPRANENGSGWTVDLPPCPCVQPDPRAVGDGWAVDRTFRSEHPGAAVCFRSYPAVRTSEGWSGQQCCYSISGRLITVGPGAGTPDRSSSCSGESATGRMRVSPQGLISHLLRDVRFWRRMPWQVYQSYWTPDAGRACGCRPAQSGNDAARLSVVGPRLGE